MNEPEVRQALDDLAAQVPARDLTGGAWRRGRRLRRWRASATAAAAAAVVAAAIVVPTQLAGHGPAPVATGNGPHHDSHEQRQGPVPYATWHRDDNPVMNALGRGKLVLDDGCVYLREPDGRRTIPIFPDQARWNPANKTITLDGQTYGIGAHVRVGGGNTGASSADHIPKTCHRNKNGSSFWQVGSISVPFATPDRDITDTATRLDGRLVLDDQCLYLQQGDQRHVLILPNSTRWNQPKQTLTLNGKTIRVRDQVSLRGSHARARDANLVPDTCHPFRKDTTYVQIGQF